MRIAVTGATGFIGRAIAMEAAARGHEVTALFRPGHAEPPRAGLAWTLFDEWAAGATPVDVVVHAAALRHRHGVAGSDYARVNIELTERVMKRARAGGGRIVLVSSISVYGWPPGNQLPIDESFP